MLQTEAAIDGEGGGHNIGIWVNDPPPWRIL